MEMNDLVWLKEVGNMKTTQEKIEEEGWEEVKEEREESEHLGWEEKGTSIKGVLKEVFQSKDGAHYGKIDTGGEKLTMFSLPTILRAKLEGLEEKEVKITYLGEVKFSTGRMGKDFRVLVKTEGEA